MACGVLLAWNPARGSEPLLPAGASVDPAVPRPEAVLGYPLGERLTDHAALRAYLEALTSGSARVLERIYGRSPEGRILSYLVVSHEENIGRIEAIRSSLLRLSDPRSLSAEETSAIIESSPVVVWLSYSVHGNESSSTEAAIAVLYRLAAARDSEMLEMLRRVVVIIDPVQNPDGRERFITYQRQVRGVIPRTDPHAAEHVEAWPSGRYNHFLFDLNRDWFFQTQAETRGKVRAYLDWMPQVFVDLHEMSREATYYFAPPAEPVNAHISERTWRWWEIFGKENAAVFDRAGFDYYTKETFDGFYPGYGDSWPTLHGAVGMTYEQATVRGLAIETDDGSTRSLEDAVRRHMTASLSTIRAAAAHRAELLGDYRGLREESIEKGRSGPARTYLIPARGRPTESRLAGLLALQGVEVLRAERQFSARVRGYDAGEARRIRFEEGTFIVPVSQPAGRLVSALMEMDPLLPDRVIAEEERRRRLDEDSILYDVTSWSLPILVGAEAYWTSESPRVPASPARAADLSPAGTVKPLGGGSVDPASIHAYLLSYDSNAAARAVLSLLKTGHRVQVASRGLRIGEADFPPGTFIIKAKGNPGSLHQTVLSIAGDTGVTFHAARSGLTDEGIDLGSPSVVTMKLPRVAVAYGEPVTPSSLGAVTYMLESIYELPHTPIRVPTLGTADLDRYDVIVLPDASASPGYGDLLGESGLRRLKTWIEAGGTLVTLKGASAFAAEEETGLITARRLLQPAQAEADPNAEDPGPDPDSVPGAILRIALEPTRYLAFGYGPEGAVPLNSDLAFSAGEKSRTIATFAGVERLRLSGFIFQESLDLLAGSSYLIEEPLGTGSVVLFADDPNFRGQWESLNRLFLNSVLFPPVFDQ